MSFLPGPAAYFLVTYCTIITLYIIGYTIVNGKKINTRKKKTIYIQVIILAIDMTLQFLYHDIAIEAIGAAIQMFYLYFNIENPDIKTVEELEIVKNEIDKANKAKSDFLSNMSSEIVHPMNTIINCSKLILKEEEPTSGNIIINGKDTTFLKQSRVPYLRRSMGIVFQDFRLLPDKTVYENVAFAMYIVKATPRHIRRQVPMVLSLVGLSGKAKMYPNELSGGEQQRVALARALVNNPSMLIADEPTGNLDPDTAWDIMTLLNDINMRGTTVVVATHAKDIVDKMKKRVIHINKGVIVRDDKKGGYDCEI